MQRTLRELAEGDRVEGMHALVEKAEVANTKAGKPYLRLTVRDSKSSIGGVMWDWDAGLHGSPKTGDVIMFAAEVGTYNGQAQLKFVNLGPSSMKPDQFARWTHLNAEAMWGDLVAVMQSMTEPLTKYVTEAIVTGVEAAYKKAPAARSVHNNWFGGLLEHVWSLTRMAEFIVAHYQKSYEPRISRDKVMFGLMLHDAGKIIEYDFNNPAFNFSPEGVFTNHMVLGPAWVYEQANKWWAIVKDSNQMTLDQFRLERAHLMHILAAHHGQIEWGSPVKPASIEAVLVHHLDNLDAKVLHAWEYAANKPGQIEHFSERSHIEGTQFYNYK